MCVVESHGPRRPARGPRPPSACALDLRHAVSQRLRVELGDPGATNRFALECGISRRQIFYVLSSSRAASLDWIERVARGLRVDPRWLLGAPPCWRERPGSAGGLREQLSGRVAAILGAEKRRVKEALVSSPLRVSKAHLYALAQGLHAVRLDVLADLAQAYGTEPWQLCTRDEEFSELGVVISDRVH
jgi:hypothetical protein